MSSNNQIPLIKYDRDLINADVPIADVMLRYLGETPDKSGKVHCPSPKHTDTQPSAKLYSNSKQNQCYCFSCSERFTPITVVMQNVTNGDFPKACETLIRDFGLSLSRYSNYDEIQEQLKQKGKNGEIELFPLTREDCKMLQLEEEFDGKKTRKDGTVERFASLPSIWAKNKEWVEYMLTDLCNSKEQNIQEIIDAETDSFYYLYASHTKEEWEEAEKWQKIREDNNIGITSAHRLPENKRELADELVVLHNLADRIADLQDFCGELAKIRGKIQDLQQQRDNFVKKAEQSPKTLLVKDER